VPFTISSPVHKLTLRQLLSVNKVSVIMSRRRLLLAAVIGAIAHFHAAAVFATSPENVIATQLHRQGVACTTPRDAVRDAENSRPLETVWTLRCDEASYRFTLVPHWGARGITPLR
jgi:hypothetical protein